jgi:hypothetical protein
MKKIFLFALIGGAFALGISSCSLFRIDNLDLPAETIKGTITDVATGEPVLTEQNSRGIRVRLTELSWGDNVTHNPDFYARDNGTYQNTKIFKGNYNVRVDGPFIPIVRETGEGDVIEDGSVTCDISGVTEVNFKVKPFLKVEFVSEPVVSGGQISVQVKVSRAVSAEEFKEAIEPMGGWKDEFLNVTDIRLYCGYSSTCNGDNQYTAWSGVLEYKGASFEEFLDKPVTITTRGTIKANRKVFIRAAARINYETASSRRYNFSEVKEVNIP